MVMHHTKRRTTRRTTARTGRKVNLITLVPAAFKNTIKANAKAQGFATIGDYLVAAVKGSKLW